MEVLSHRSRLSSVTPVSGARASRRAVLAAGAGAICASIAGCGPDRRDRAPASPAAGASEPTSGGATTGASATTSPGRAYLGTYGQGIGTARVDATTGAPVVEGWQAAVRDASWLALNADGSVLYAINEQAAGTVSALRASAGGSPVPLNTVATGSGPAHVAVHPAGRFLFTSLYGGGAVVTHPIAADGSVGAASDVRRHGASGADGAKAHAHQVVVDPSGAYVLAVDLGVDTVFVYALDPARGALREVRRTGMPAGSGPRHLAFHPNGRFAYVVAENAATVTVCSWDGGVLTPGQVIAAAPGGVTNHPAEIAVSADGRFGYVSNRGPNTVGVFAVGADGARLDRVAAPDCGGDWPRHLALDPGGRRLYVANQRSGSVVWFPLDPATGRPGKAAGTLRAPGVAQVLLS
jgi:6-phosphogluconolactonase (cycloisomerase 2 family)